MIKGYNLSGALTIRDHAGEIVLHVRAGARGFTKKQQEQIERTRRIVRVRAAKAGLSAPLNNETRTPPRKRKETNK